MSADTFGPRSRSRNSPSSYDQIIGRSYYAGIPVGTTTLIKSKQSSWSQQTTDYVHKRAKDGVYRVGSPFNSFKSSQTVQRTGAVHLESGQYTYDGEIVATFDGVDPISLEMDWNEGIVSGYGAEAWRKYAPGRPKVSVAQFVGELRDFPRMLHKIAESIKGCGSAYLATEFGWKPFLRDIYLMYTLSKQIPLELQKIRNLNGKWHLREGRVSMSDTITDSWDISDDWPNSHALVWGINTMLAGDHSNFRRAGQTSRKRDVWFSGRFRYWIPEVEINSVEWERKTVQKLYGFELTPELVWELMPWSWLIDYFGSIGDAIANIADGSVNPVAKYAYVMGTTTFAQEQRASFIPSNHSKVERWIKRERVYKHRVHAYPFMFQGFEDDLSLKQFAILAALGVSRWSPI